MPILDPLRALLLEWREHGTTGLVARNDAGNPIDARAAARQLRSARAKIADGWPQEKLKSPYSLRHTHACIGLNSGVPVPEIAKRLGHDPAVLLSTYAHVIVTDERKWSRALGDSLSDHPVVRAARTAAPCPPDTGGPHGRAG